MENSPLELLTGCFEATHMKNEPQELFSSYFEPETQKFHYKFLKIT